MFAYFISTQAPSSLLEALESHHKTLEGHKKGAKYVTELRSIMVTCSAVRSLHDTFDDTGDNYFNSTPRNSHHVLHTKPKLNLRQRTRQKKKLNCQANFLKYGSNNSCSDVVSDHIRGYFVTHCALIALL